MARRLSNLKAAPVDLRLDVVGKGGFVAIRPTFLGSDAWRWRQMKRMAARIGNACGRRGSFLLKYRAGCQETRT
jgi:hypothetical protein